MPGLKQLKKFSEDIRNLGNELKERQNRGEPVENFPLPQNISDADDSDDFILGLPVDTSDDIPNKTTDDDEEIPELADIVGAAAGTGIPDNISNEDNSIFNTDTSSENIDLNGLDPDLAKFFMENQPGDVSGEQSLPDFDNTSSAEKDDIATEPADLQDIPDIEELPDISDDAVSGDSSQDESSAAAFKSVSSQKEQNIVPKDTGSVSNDGVEDLEPLEELEELDSFDTDDKSVAGNSKLNDNESEIPSGNLPPITENQADLSNKDESPLSDIQDFSMPDDSSLDGIGSPESEIPTADDITPIDSLENDKTEPADISDDGFPPLDSEGFSTNADETSNETSNVTSDETSTGNSGNNAQEPVEDFSEAVPSDDMDFGSENADSDLSQSDGDNFSIPGFEMDDIPGGHDLSMPDFSSAESASNASSNTDRPLNAITDKDYKAFLENIKDYPLNLRIVLEDFIVKNEFTDEAAIEVINKVVKKVPARQLAAHLEKLLDITISVPRDFERRTVAQYEAYKTSIEYQIKNRIIPGLLIFGALAVAGIIIFFFVNRFIYRPLLAESLYKQGYTLLENSMYPQSESKFNEALAVKSKKKWFFTYARGYRERKQYDRARKFYEQLLVRYNYDKTAGLEYADMEFTNLSNYEKAEEITRRKILDYHINDKDALLLLGDIFLEWGTEKDSSKLDDAFQVYNELIELYGNTDLYSSRLLRYYIRTDNLREVLPLKSYFFENKKSLGAADLTEMSGYLLDKLYGDLPAADEYLRDYIEDVRALLERAEKADPSIPESQYNLARYFVYTDNNSAAESYCKKALDAFDGVTDRKPARIRKHIDTYKILGELYTAQQEYIIAEESFASGIEMYETEARESAFKSDENIGKLYADIADIDYFISGDFDTALRNYNNAVKNFYDNPSVNYRIGYIDYIGKNYKGALDSFIKTVSGNGKDRHVLLALGNVLSLRNDNYAAQGYYEQLVSQLDTEREKYGIMFPQVRADQADIVELCMKAENNLGVTLGRLAERTGNSAMNAESLVHLAESTRAWDALTRNQETMIRLSGSNLAEQNIKYMTYPVSGYEPAIYTSIPQILVGEKTLTQPVYN